MEFIIFISNERFNLTNEWLFINNNDNSNMHENKNGEEYGGKKTPPFQN